MKRRAEEKEDGGQAAPLKRPRASEAYLWTQLHDDLQNGKKAGVYGGCNSPWFGLSEIRANLDMKAFHNKRTKDEFYLPGLHSHINKPATQKRWNEIVTFDPLGMYAGTPTMSACEARLQMKELENEVTIDGKVVNDDWTVNIQKCAIDYAWNIPGLCARLGYEEERVRDRLFDWTQNPSVKDHQFNCFLPPLGGLTVYIIGDVTKLGDPRTEVAVRVHDSCAGSDVFGTDICTCRPYLVFGVQCCVEVAQRGGVGLIVYFQKEGRSLGEVTKYRVYNARKAQKGGDCAENYFYQTESIAGIRDARFQELMPDVLIWLGIERVDYWLSMSSEKYDAAVEAGIDIRQRIALPEKFVPEGAMVEITAKIAAGYQTNDLAPQEIIRDLRSLDMIRVRCNEIFTLAKENRARHFSLHLNRLDEVTDFVIKITKQAYPKLDIPYHSRWRHFKEDEVAEVRAAWPCPEEEKVRRLLDACFVSVLLDAGAGANWKYVDHQQKEQNRSEGLAIASWDMFMNGVFSSDPAAPHRVNSLGLKNLTLQELNQGFQVNKNNPMVGLEGRFGLLQRLAAALDNHPEYFGPECPRPGNILDYVLKHTKNNRVSIRVLWETVIVGLESIWPENSAGVRRGDVWHYNAIKAVGSPASDMVPFHKLSQWLTYSLLEPIESLGITFDDMHLLTGLAEYRNGGLMVDFGVLTLREDEQKLVHDVGSELVVEWRALTVCLLDELAVRVRAKLKLTEEQLPLAKVLQGGTWTAGRMIAAEKRPDRSSPVQVRSDGTVF